MTYLLAIIFFVIDRITKLYFSRLLIKQSFNQIPIINNFFNFTLVRNKGAAFGIFQGKGLFLILITFLIIAVIIYIYYKEHSKLNTFAKLSYSLLLGGAAGNLFDRLFVGYVIDFIDFTFWPTFNFADIFINIGVAGLLIYYFFMQSNKGASK